MVRYGRKGVELIRVLSEIAETSLVAAYTGRSVVRLFVEVAGKRNFTVSAVSRKIERTWRNRDTRAAAFRQIYLIGDPIERVG